MRNLSLVAAAVIAAGANYASPSQAAVTLVGSFTGNACTGQGGINNCYATQTGTQQGNPGTPFSSPLIARIESSGGVDVSTLFPTISGSEFSLNYNGASNSLSFTYTPGTGDPAIHYFGVFQANTYDLFYDANAITSGTINLNSYFPNNPGFSHIDFFDTGSSVPEPATWAMMLIGFGAMGAAFRWRRNSVKTRKPALV